MQQVTHYWKTPIKCQSISQADSLLNLIEEADAVVVGIGAGMSAAAGFTYVGDRFTKAFPDFIEKYRLLDMLQASLFEFEDLQEYWAFQSRFSLLNFFDQPVGQAYIDLRHMLADKNYHIITTNADNAFYAAEYNMDKVYQDEALIRRMVVEQSDMKIPSYLIPYCPQCGAGLEVNKRTEEKGMVEDEYFQDQALRYKQFLKDTEHQKVLFLEIGVGNTTPQFIKHPFQQMTEMNEKALFVTMN